MKMHKYLYHILSSTWRKKSSLLFLSIMLMLIIFGLQYTKNDIEIEAMVVKSHTEKVVLTSVYPKPQREDTFPRQIVQHRDNAILETDQQLGIPFVNSYLNNLYIPKKRIVHLDLKGAPPRVSYYKRFFPFIKNLGATGVLIEYEDMFPYDGVLTPIAAKNAYSKLEIKEILKMAEASKLEVIPLVQTFGHLEFALKVQNFSMLREVPGSPQALCPKRNGSLDFIKEMVDQVMAMHPKIERLHIGCDEVYQMGECNLCRLELHETLFLRHLRNVSTMITRRYPRVKLIIWDDMLRHVSQQSMLDMNISSLVEPMVWVYAEDIYRFVQPSVWDKYANVFSRVWAASAFKGAFGETLYVPDAKRHLENNLRWLDLMSRHSRDFKEGFVGIALTGWQRYDHFAVLCELLPAGTPSLGLSLTAVSFGYFNASLKSFFLAGLSCPDSSDGESPFIALDNDPFLWDKLGRCLFPGNQMFRLVYRLHNFELETKDFLRQVREQKGWLTDYNGRRKFSSPLRIEEITLDLPRIYHNTMSLIKSSFEDMGEIFDNFTVYEWVEQRIYGYAVELEKIEKESTAIRNVNVWPVRPLPISLEIKKIVDNFN